MTVADDIEVSSAPVAPSLMTVIREVGADGVNRVVFVVVTGAVGLAYSVLLPFDYTQRISFANWHYVGWRYGVFATLLALGIAWVVTLQVHAVRRIKQSQQFRQARQGGLGLFASVVSLLPSFLCCSPIIPTLVGLLGLSATARLTTAGRLEHFFATEQTWVLVGAVAIMAVSGLWATRSVARATCATGACTSVGCATEADPADSKKSQ